MTDSKIIFQKIIRFDPVIILLLLHHYIKRGKHHWIRSKANTKRVESVKRAVGSHTWNFLQNKFANELSKYWL